MDDREYRLKRTETAVAVMGLVGLVIGGLFTYLTYRQSAELQALRALNDEKLKVCESLSSSAASLYSVEKSDSLRKIYYQLSEIKHGKGLMLLDKEVLSQAVRVHNALVNALGVADGSDFQDQVRCLLKDEPLKLALACRAMLGEDLRTESGMPVSPIDPSYVMGWNQACEKK